MRNPFKYILVVVVVVVLLFVVSFWGVGIGTTPRHPPDFKSFLMHGDGRGWNDDDVRDLHLRCIAGECGHPYILCVFHSTIAGCVSPDVEGVCTYSCFTADGWSTTTDNDVCQRAGG